MTLTNEGRKAVAKQPMSATEFHSKLSAAAPGVSAQDASALQTAGLDLNTILQWIQEFGPKIMPIVMFLFNLFKSPQPTPPAPQV